MSSSTMVRDILPRSHEQKAALHPRRLRPPLRGTSRGPNKEEPTVWDDIDWRDRTEAVNVPADNRETTRRITTAPRTFPGTQVSKILDLHYSAGIPTVSRMLDWLHVQRESTVSEMYRYAYILKIESVRSAYPSR